MQTHISVRASRLRTFVGTYTNKGTQMSLPDVTTTSGDTLVAQINNAALRGAGLTGKITFDPSQPLGNTGEVFLATVHPDGSSSFFVNDVCTCSFQGHSGTVTIRASGTTSARGLTRGTFIIVGAVGGLATLAGNGKFTSAGQSNPANLALVEHLRIT